MLFFLPLISLVLLVVIFQTQELDWRNSLLSGLIAWGVILTAITELLSLVKLVNFAWLTLLWLLVAIILGTIYWRSKPKSNRGKIPSLSKLSFFSQILIGGIGIIVALVGLVAIVAPPNHSDSMEYHMSRIVHWMQNGSVAHYPSHTLFQLYQNPWSEFAIMHFQILSGGDRFANLIQWGSMLGSIIGVSLIARRLGANLRGQILAAVVCATIPMGILQGSSTNNDYVVAFWLVCLAYFTLLIVQEGVSTANTAKVGASLGLAILTKGTAYVFALPFCLWLGVWGIRKLRWRVWKPIAIVLIILLAINLGHYTRNFTLFGSPLGLSSAETNEEFGIAIFISNVTRNLALHADIVRSMGLEKIITPTTGLSAKLVEVIHGFLGLDVNDPRAMSPKVNKFYVPASSTYEDTAVNPVHLALILLSLFFLLFNKRLRRQPYLFSYFFAVTAGFLLFCFLFTWSPWRCRLHLPLFVLLAAFVGVVLTKSLNYRITSLLAIILILLSHSWVFQNSVRPLVGNNNIFAKPRITQYFNTQAHLENAYTEAVKLAQSQSCSDIGLYLEYMSFEYPLGFLLQQGQEKAKIRHVNVTNESSPQAKKSPYSNFQPCMIIAVTRKQEPEKELMSKNKTYSSYWSEKTGRALVEMFVPE